MLTVETGELLLSRLFVSGCDYNLEQSGPKVLPLYADMPESISSLYYSLSSEWILNIDPHLCI